MESIAIKIDIKKAEKVRKILLKKKLLRKDLKFIKDKKYIYLPIKNFQDEKISYPTVKKDFKEYKKKIENYKQKVDIPSKLKINLPKSYDIIGKIILIKLKKDLLNYKKNIGNALLSTKKNIETVCLIHPIHGEYRKRKVEIIAGIKQTKTIHNEYGLKFIVDVKKVYFSPRLANERKRISKLVKHGETILDMFTGIAPFSIMIGRYSEPKIIYAIDKNKDAIKLAKLNVKLNNLLDKIEVICEDAGKIKNLFNKNGIKADRIIMNLPFSGYLFFKNALEIAANNCIIHYYDILNRLEIDNRVKYLQKISNESGYNIYFNQIKKIKTYSPRVFYIGIDIIARKIGADVA